MNTTDQVEVVDEETTAVVQPGIELNLSDLDLVAGGSIGQLWM